MASLKAFVSRVIPSPFAPKSFTLYTAALAQKEYNTHKTNNIAEGNNHKLNELFNKKPSTIRLLYEIKKEEGLIKSLYGKIEACEFYGKRKHLKEYYRDFYKQL